MKDPFFIPPIPWLSAAIQPLAKTLHLPTLPLHIHELLGAALLYAVIYYPLSPLLSTYLVPQFYGPLTRKQKRNWDAHVVSMVQCLFINLLAIWVMRNDMELRAMDAEERVLGYTGATGLIQALAAGYFLWDLSVCSMNMDVFGAGDLAHAVSAMSVYCLGFRPFLTSYSCTFILWELSTFFLNIHWFMDKTGLTGSSLQLYNGIALLSTFFLARLVYGTYSSFCFISDVYTTFTLPPPLRKVGSGSQVMMFTNKESQVPVWLAGAFLTSNVVLNGLNAYWFVKMVAAVKRRFDPAAQKRYDEKHGVKIEGGGLEDGAAVVGDMQPEPAPKTKARRRKA